ncbi:unnamed protein product [Trichogramma brassicae]|uniref:Uncharacterized protein n=1 Tax=Trichogramma brassicae TaxID=86971 RepID=A0A6H5J0M6_9HYME|nr:unnamed protein product [Trichogramma brassicae]
MSDDDFVAYPDFDADSNSDDSSCDEDSSYDGSFYFESSDEKLTRLKNMREALNWEIEAERSEFFNKFKALSKGWHEDFLDLRDIFRREEIDWLLIEDMKSQKNSKMGSRQFPLIKFVLNTGYTDEPEQGGGPSSLLRSTPLHYASRDLFPEIINHLFDIYHRCDVNYSDESGYSHFHAACSEGHYDTVKKFLELGQVDINCPWPKTGESPLYLALKSEKSEVFRLLLLSGADPNSTNADGTTCLHDISKEGYQADLAEILLERNDEGELRYAVQVDARDKSGRTPLQVAVAHVFPELVRLLLDRGADLSNFVFPTECHFDKGFDISRMLLAGIDELQITTDALVIVEQLEQKGYELARSDAVTMMKTLVKHRLFEKAEQIEFWREDEDFVSMAKEIMIIPSSSLYDSIQMRPGKAKNQLTNRHYFKFLVWEDWEELSDEMAETCVAHLCEKIWERFFQQWTLEPLMKLTELPILCCEKIMENLMNKDLLKICLADEIVPNKHN